MGFGGIATPKSTLQCNVGNKSPVYLCSLYPGKTESLQLNLELEEVDDVVFSVIGPRSIHLCGYYLAGARNTNAFEESYPCFCDWFPFIFSCSFGLLVRMWFLTHQNCSGEPRLDFCFSSGKISNL